MRPSGLWLILFALAGVPAAFGEPFVYVTLASDILLFFLLWIESRRMPVQSEFTIHRVLPDFVDDGDEVEVVLQLSSLSRLKLQVVDVAPGPQFFSFTGRLGSVSDLHFSYKITVQRGLRYEWGPLMVLVYSPLSLAARRLELHRSGKLFIRPHALLPQGKAVKAVGFRGHGQLLGSRPGSSRYFLSLREMTHGDSLRAVDWKATARRGKMIIRQYAESRRLPTCAVLDLGVNMSRVEGGLSLLDHGIGGVWQLAQQVRALGEPFRLVAVGQGETEVTRGGSDLQSLRALRQKLTYLELGEGGVGLLRCLQSTTLPGNQKFLIVVFTEVNLATVDEQSLLGLRVLARRHQVLVVQTMEMPRAGSVASPFEAAAQYELWSEAQQIQRILRGVGIELLLVSPGGVSQEVMRRHAALYRQGVGF